MSNRRYHQQHSIYGDDKVVRVSQEVPRVSLGKPSLRARLESYYNVIQPDIVSCPYQWEKRFQLIWDKFGGTVEGEELLANKLMKKYGRTAVIFQTAAPMKSDTSQRGSESMELYQAKLRSMGITQNSNEWYELNEKEKRSGCIDFLSDRFDPEAVLQCNPTSVEQTNPFVVNVPILDRVDLFRSFLPVCDPLHVPPKPMKNRIIKSTVPEQDTASKSSQPVGGGNNLFRHVPTCFVDTVKWHETGPYSLLYDILVQKQRIRVVTRYVNSIRGTLTGYITAFDQHMNLLMHDVEEQYCPRQITNHQHNDDNENHHENLSNSEAELQRRINCVNNMPKSSNEKLNTDALHADTSSTATTTTTATTTRWTHRHRYMRQILVRGDTIVLLYKASDERSSFAAIPSPSIPPKPRYKKNIDQSPQQHIGTPGSFVTHNNNNNDNRCRRNISNSNNLNEKIRSNRSNRQDYKSNF